MSIADPYADLDDPELDDPELDDPQAPSPQVDDPILPAPPSLPVTEATYDLTDARYPRSALASRIVLALLVLAYIAFFAWATLTRYHAFESRALDMGNLNQAVWNIAHGDWFHQTNQSGVTNRLSLHVEPILLPIAALYLLYPQPEALLLLQAIIVALGAIPLFALARRQRLPDGLALLLAAAWLLMPAIQSANMLEFHPVTLAPTFFMAAFYFLVSRRVGWYALFALLAACCKEEMGLLVAMMGLYALIFLRMRRVGIFSILLGVGWSLFAVMWVQKQFGENIHWGRYAWLGDDPVTMLKTAVTQPGMVVTQLQQASIWDYLFRLLLPVGFLALLAPEVLLIALPSFAINLMADFAPMHQVTGLIYAAPIAPFVMLAAVMGVGRLWRWTHPDPDNRRMGLWMWLATLALLAGMALAQWWYGYLPGMANYRAYAVSAHDERAAAVISQLLPSDRLSSQDKINPHVSGRTTSYIFPDETGDNAAAAETVPLSDPDRPADAANAWLIDATGSAWPLHPNDVQTRVGELFDAGAIVAAADDGYLLLRAPVSGTAALSRTVAARSITTETVSALELPEAFYNAWRNPASTPVFTQTARFGENLELLGYSLSDDVAGDTILELYWRTKMALDSDYSYLIRYVDGEGKTVFDSLFYQPPAALWYPVSEWEPGERVLVTALPWHLEDDQVDIAVGLYAGSDDNDRLPISDVASSSALLDGGTLLHLGTFSRLRIRFGSEWSAAAGQDIQPALLDARFGDTLALEAATILPYAPGDMSVRTQLQWRLLDDAPQTWNLVLQLLDSAGNRVAQLDTQPHIGAIASPLAETAAGEALIGDYALSLPKALPAGDYTLAIGVRDWNADREVPVEGANLLANNFVSLGVITVP